MKNVTVKDLITFVNALQQIADSADTMVIALKRADNFLVMCQRPKIGDGTIKTLEDLRDQAKTSAESGRDEIAAFIASMN
jgi:hypothetical protein